MYGQSPALCVLLAEQTSGARACSLLLCFWGDGEGYADDMHTSITLPCCQTCVLACDNCCWVCVCGLLLPAGRR